MPVTADLININSLALSDTFQTWVNRTNQIIDDLNPLQVYDVEVGADGGLLKETGISAGNYNGVVTISVNPGPGVGTWTLGGATRTVVDFTEFDTYSLELTGGASGAASSVNSSDEFLINDISDTQQSVSGTVKKVQARHMLPYEIAGDHLFTNNITIGGNLIVQGTDTFIAANNLRIEDKQIELAYQRAIALTITGATGGTFLPASFGATAYHFTTLGGLTPDIYGQFESYTGSAAGPTAEFTIGSLFQDPYDADDLNGVTGYVSLSATGSTRYLVVSTGTPFSSFLSDNELDQGGIILKGASGDKGWVWINDDPTYVIQNSWASLSANVGVHSPTSHVISSIYRPYSEIGGDDDIYIVNNETSNGAGVSVSIGTAPDTISDLNEITYKFRLTKPSNDSSISIATTTGQSSSPVTNAVFYTSIAGAGGATGANWRALPGVTANNFGKNINVDQLDGAHGYTSASPYSIPISGEYGTIDDSWTETAAIRRRITQASHGLTMGNVVRVNSSGSYVKAIASSAQLGEAIGMVSSVSGDSFVVTLKGKISGLSGAVQTVEGSAYTPGEVYFLSGSTAGKLIVDPDNAVLTKIPSGGVRKPMFVSTTPTEGYVLGYVGSIVSDPTDELYLDGLVPIGTVYPFAASSAFITEEWLICDGARTTRAAYPDLYTVTNGLFYANATGTASSASIIVDGGIRNLQATDVVTLRYNGVDYERTISSVNSGTNTITLTATLPTTATYELRATRDTAGDAIFFIPDLRSKFVRGKGTSQNIGALAGADSVVLTTANLPSHAHNLNQITTNAQAGSGLNLVQDGTTNDTITGLTGSGSAVATLPSYVALYYIIRAKHKTKATILTGHDHDLRYIRYDATHSGLTDGGRSQFRTNAEVAGLPLGSSLSATAGTHNHDLRYVRFDAALALSTSQAYQHRINANISAYGEGDGYPNSSSSTAHNHDFIYPRFDGLAQGTFDGNETVKSAFRTKLGVMSSTEANDRFVNVTGDTMTGALVITGSNLTLKNSAFYMNDSGSAPTFIEFNTSTRYAFFNVERNSNSVFLVQVPSMDNSVSGRGDNKDIFRAFANPTPNEGDSSTEVYLFGDLTMWADGQTSGSLAGISNPVSQVATFGIDPHKGRMFIGGYQLRTDGSRVEGPRIDFYDGSDYNSPSTHGSITGLTFPTQGHNAVNKDYVDTQNAFFRHWAYGSGSDGLTSSNGILAPIFTSTSGIDASANPVVKTGVTLTPGYWNFQLNFGLIPVNINTNCDLVFKINSNEVRTKMRGGYNEVLQGSMGVLVNVSSSSGNTIDVSLTGAGSSVDGNWTHVEIIGTKVGNIYTA